MEKREKVFTREITTVIKGLMIVWLIMHHAIGSSHFIDDGSTFFYIVGKIASRGAAVVAGFAFLSGYGLNETYRSWVIRRGSSPSLGGKIAFSYTRIFRLLVSLWIVYIIFVGAILIRDPGFLRESYEGSIALGILKNLTGNLLPLNTGTVNKSWWFVRAICSFYLIYPFVKCIDGTKLRAFLITLASFAVTIPVLGHPQNTRIFWYFQFFLGYFCSEVDFFGWLRKNFSNGLVFIAGFAAFICTNLAMFKFGSYPFFPLWGLTLVVTMYGLYSLAPGAAALWKPLTILGVYSSDMYLLHVFVHGRLLPEVVYLFMNPVWIVVSDVLICLLFSWLLSLLKKKTGLSAALTRLCPDKR